MKRKRKVIVEKVEIIEIPPEHRKLADELLAAIKECIEKEKSAIIEKKLKARRKKSKNDYR